MVSTDRSPATIASAVALKDLAIEAAVGYLETATVFEMFSMMETP